MLIGGRAKAITKEYNVNKMNINNYLMYGYFTNEKLVLARFKNDHEEYFNNDSALYDTTKDSINDTNIIVRNTYTINENGVMYFKVEVNDNFSDLVYLKEGNLENSETELLSKKTKNFRDLTFHYLP